MSVILLNSESGTLTYNIVKCKEKRVY